MPVLVILAALFGVMVLLVILMPVSLLLRYRAGKTRRQARRWIASVNIAGLVLSVVLCVSAAAVASRWTPGALTYTLGGLGAGALVGLLGLTLTRWETTRGKIYFTPNAWLALVVTLVVAARVGYGFWRIWYELQAGFDHTSAIVADGIRTSLAAGGLVIGYYLTFWIGVRRRIKGRRQGRIAAATR